MPTPLNILIDTCIFDQYGYNFSSPIVETFVAVAGIKKFILILPDVIEREIRRHINEKSHEAASALKRARKDAPLLAKWSHWQANEVIKAAAAEIQTKVMGDWEQFLKNFKVEKLGYDGIDMTEIMDWYDRHRAPFGEGQKRKEFPDAFAIAAAFAYCKHYNTEVAVVSSDPDFRKACGHHPELLHFPDLPALTEALIAEPEFKILAIKETLRKHPEPLVAQIGQDFSDLGFYPEEDLMDGEVSDVEVKSVEITETKVLAVHGYECTVAIHAHVDFSAYVSYGDPDTMVIDSSEDFRMALFQRAGTVTEQAHVSATVTLEFDDTWTSILSVGHVKFEDQYLAVESRPPIDYDSEEMDEPTDDTPDPPSPVEPPYVEPPDGSTGAPEPGSEL
jgi:hypothetical protein